MWKQLAAATALLLIAAAPALAAGAPELHDGGEGFKVRPAAILVSGDGTAWLGGKGFGDPGDWGTIRWTRYRRSGAHGDGRIFLSDCRPDCAGGTFSSWHAVIRATRVRKGRFTRLSARYRRKGEAVTRRWRLQVNSSTYAYWVAR